MTKKLLLALVTVPFLSLSAYAHEKDAEHKCDGKCKHEEKDHKCDANCKCPKKDMKDEKCEHEKMDMKHDECEHDEEEDSLTRAFEEGTLNLVSPTVYEKDTLSIQYSHNFYANSFPRGSNPFFSISYAPIDNLQIDLAASLRQDEYEGGIKYQILNDMEKDFISLTPKLSFNWRGKVAGLDLSASKLFFKDILQVGVNYRIMNYFGDTKLDALSAPLAQAVGANAILRVWKHWSIFGDVVVPFDGKYITDKGFVWSAGLKKVIDDSPHILTLYVGNSNESTLTGKTFSSFAKYPDALKVGFNFSIDIEHASKLPKRLF